MNCRRDASSGFVLTSIQPRRALVTTFQRPDPRRSSGAPAGWCLALLFAVPSTGLAYVDPGAAGILIQRVIALIAFVGAFWRRLRMRSSDPIRTRGRPGHWAPLKRPMPISRVGGSFRDPLARLFSSSDGKLIRGLSGVAARGFELAYSSGWLKREIDKGHVVAYADVLKGEREGDAQVMAARFRPARCTPANSSGHLSIRVDVHRAQARGASHLDLQ